ncbi:MAG: FAD-dependent oxidoreductase [Pseudomonadota bacterium]
MTGAVANTVGRVREVFSLFERLYSPLLILAVRLWLAKIFLEHALMTATADPALLIGADWLTSLEATSAVLIALGLLTRLAAIPVVLISLFVYVGGQGIEGHILCALLASALVVGGPGPLSLDAIVGRGLRRSPLPYSEWPALLYGRLQSVGMPVLRLVFRLFMALLFWTAGLSAQGFGTGVPISFGPIQIVPSDLVAPAVLQAFPAGLAPVYLAAAVLLAVGFGSRLVAFGLAVLSVLVLIGDQGRPEHLLWVLILAHLVFAGPGLFSVDWAVERAAARRWPELGGGLDFSLEDCPRVVVVGAGFGGLAAAHALRHAKAQVTVIDRHNYYLFQPLLYQVATAGLSPADIAMPIRGILRDQPNTRVHFAKVDGVNTDRKEVLTDAGTVPFDYLILATGARHAYFGNDQWETVAPGLKKIDDATHVRQRILLAFERAETTTDPAERRRLMTFVVVGAGPTGVELAGSIAELAKQGMRKDFRSIDPADARVILIQGAPRVLPMFPDSLSDQARESLESMGVEVLLDSIVTDIDPTGVSVKDTRIDAGTVLWAAGVRASRAGKWLDAETDRAGRVIVEPDLSVPGHKDIFVVGDTAAMNNVDGVPVPGLAPAAKQSGAHAARIIEARLKETDEPGAFRYRHMGSLATIGRASAIADFGWVKLSGSLAWWLWGVVHVFFLLGTRNRLAVMMNWIWSYLTYRNSTRLITGDLPEAQASSPESKAAA